MASLAGNLGQLHTIGRQMVLTEYQGASEKIMQTAEDRELVTSIVQAFSMPLLPLFPVQQRLHCRGSVGGFWGIEKRISIIRLEWEKAAQLQAAPPLWIDFRSVSPKYCGNQRA